MSTRQERTLKPTFPLAHLWPFAVAVAVLLAGDGPARAAEAVDWAALKAGDTVEVDVACTGDFRRMTVEAIGTDEYNASRRKYTLRRQDGTSWTFGAPGIVAPCMRPLSALATMPVKASGGSQPWQGLYLQLQPTGTSYACIHYYFWKDGRYCEGLPVGGLDREPADFDTVQAHTTCGQYRVTGARLSLQRQGDAQARDMVLRIGRKREDGFEINGYATAPVGSYRDGQTIDGSYAATLVAEQTRLQVYAFRRDGTYSFKSSPVTSRDGPARSSVGTYRLVGNSLQLRGGAGPERQTIYPLPNGSLMIAGQVYTP